MIAYLINQMLDELVELKRIRSNTSWVLCQPQLNYGKFVAEKEWERQDALTEEAWRIKNCQRCAMEAKDTFAQLKEIVLDAIKQFKRKQEVERLRRNEEDEKYRWEVWCRWEWWGRDNAWSHSAHSSRRESSSSRSASQTQPTTHDEQPWRRIDRKQTFGQSTSVPEVKDAHQESALEEKAQGTETEKAQAEEVQDEEVDIDQDYDLTKSPFNPMDNYLGSEHEATLVVKSQPMLHDPLPRYVTETKYLIDLGSH